MEFIVVGLVCGAICAVMAENRKRSKIGWFFAGLIFGIFAIVGIALAGQAKVPAE